MNTSEKVHYYVGLVKNTLTRRREKAWAGLSILVIRDETAAPPTSYRINYYLLLFVGVIVIFLPAFALGSDSTSLTAITQASGANDVFSRQLRALAQAGDVLLLISSGEPSQNLSRAMQSAHERGADVVLLSNQASGDLASLIRAEDVEIRVDTTNTASAVEIYTMAIHSICTLIEHGLFGAHQE